MRLFSILSLVLVIGYIGCDLVYKDYREQVVTENISILHKTQKNILGVTQYLDYMTATSHVAENVSTENLELRKTVTLARETVKQLTTELEVTKVALTDSIKLLREQQAENTKLHEQLETLRIFINDLMAKIPDANKS